MAETAKIIEFRRRATARVKKHYDKHIRPVRAAKRAKRLEAWCLPISAIDASWAAGLFEGEGSVIIHKTKKGVAGFEPRVAVHSTDKEIIEIFCKYWPGRMCGPYEKNGKANSSRWKPFYHWAQTDQFKVREFLRTISPYLKRTIVRERVAIVLEFCERALAVYRQPGQEHWKELLYDKLKPLNKRGRL